MRGKIKTLSLSAIVLCLFIIVIKVSIELFIQGIVNQNLISLGLFEYDKAANYYYLNYISLMKVDTIGLTIAILAASVLVSVAFYIKLVNTMVATRRYKQIFISMFSLVNGLAVISTMFIIFSEFTVFYRVLQLLLGVIFIMIIVDAIYSFAIHQKSFKKFMKSLTTVSSIVLLGLGLYIHFVDMYRVMDCNEAILDYHQEVAEDMFKDEPNKESLIKQYMFQFEELHSNKGLLIGMNNVTYNCYKFVYDNDGHSPFYKPLPTELKQLYEEYTEEMTFNIPLLAALGVALIAVFFGSLIEQEINEEYHRNVTILLEKLEEYKMKLDTAQISLQEYETLKELLFEKY